MVVCHLVKQTGLGLPGFDFGPAWGHKHGVLLHVVVIPVVTCVGEFPAEEGNEQHAVKEPAGDGVDGEIGGERIMAAVVGKDPEPGEETSLNETVQSPERDLDRQGCIQLGQLDRAVEQGAHNDQVPDDVGERTDKGAFEALCGDGVSKCFDVRKGSDIGHYLDGSSSPDSSSRRSHDFWKMGIDRNSPMTAAEARVL